MADGVVFLPSFHEAIKELPDADRLNAYDAIICYGIYGEVLEMSPVVKALFALMKPVVDSSQRRYKAAKANGALPPKDPERPRGRPRKNQSENQTKNQSENQEKEIEKEIEIDSDFDIETDIDSEKEKDFEFERETEKEKESLREKEETDVSDLAEQWHSAATPNERFKIANKLYCIGWNIDPVTGALARRS